MFADPDVLISRIPDQLSVELDGEIAILKLESKMYFGLTDVGAFIWNWLETPTVLITLAQAVSAHFEVNPAQAAADAERFLSELEGAGLLKITRKNETSSQKINAFK